MTDPSDTVTVRRWSAVCLLSSVALLLIVGILNGPWWLFVITLLNLIGTTAFVVYALRAVARRSPW